MHKYIKTLIIILLLSSLFHISASAESVISINDLIENAKELDGQEVVIQGEAIGERMDRGNYSWVNMNDGTNAIGIWIDKLEAKKIYFYGNYKYIGDKVRVTGVFNRACKEHGGEADVHYTSMNIVKNGYQVKEQISPFKIITAVILFVVVIFMLIFFYKKIKIKN